MHCKVETEILLHGEEEHFLEALWNAYTRQGMRSSTEYALAYQPSNSMTKWTNPAKMNKAAKRHYIPWERNRAPLLSCRKMPRKQEIWTLFRG
jgi:hypothetical protein